MHSLHRYMRIIALQLLFFSAFGQGEMYEIKKLAISNNKYNEFSVAFIDSQIYCISDNIQYGLKKKEDILGNPLFDIIAYNVSKKKYKKTSTPITKLANTSLNEGGFCISDSSFFFTRNSGEKNRKNKEQKPLNIFYTELQENGDWTTPKALFSNYENSNVSFAHPSISEDGEMLFYTSNLLDTTGKSDIYYSKRIENNTWSKPERLPETINTTALETFPSFVDGKGLYFTTDRNTNHGLDIYFSAFENGSFSEAQMLPPPYNTSFDDFTYLAHNNLEFISSNRQGTDDIYKITPLFPTFEANAYQPVKRCFVFFEESLSFSNALPLKYEWNLGDGTTLEGEEAYHCFDTTGNYLIQLNIIDTISNEVVKNEVSFNFELKDPFQIDINIPDTIYINTPYTLSYSLPESIKNQKHKVYFDLGNLVKQSASESTINYSTPGNYKITVGAIYGNDSEIEKKIATFKKIVAITQEDKLQK